jgi:hypothetical protein
MQCLVVSGVGASATLGTVSKSRRSGGNQLPQTGLSGRQSAEMNSKRRATRH